MFFWKRKIKTSYSLLFDFRSSSLAFALIQKAENNSIILKSGREHFYFKKIEDINKCIDTFYKTLEKQTFELIKEYPFLKNNLDGVEILIASPWYDSKIRNFSLTNDKKQKITIKFLNEIIQKNVFLEAGQELLESKITDLKINGYSVVDPIKKNFDHLNFSVYQSFLSVETHEDISKILKDNLGEVAINIHSHPLVFFTLLKDIFYQTSNSIIFDVGGETTEITIIIDNKIDKVLTIPIGNHYFIRNLVMDCSYEEHTAWSKFDMLAAGHLDEQCVGAEQKMFNKFQKNWRSELDNVLKKNNIINTPANIFIVSDKSVQKLIKKIIEIPETYAGSLKNNRKPEIVICDKEILEKPIKYKNAVENDTIITLFSEYLKKVDKIL